MSELGPDESLDMAARKALERFSSTVTNGCTARLGRLAIPGRKVIETPNFNGVTSRGAVPHLTPDSQSQYTSFGATYLALEDFIEKKDPPILKMPHGKKRPLNAFTALPSDQTTILAPRRCPAVTAPVGNGSNTMSVFTSTGFYNLSVPRFASAVETLLPDVVVPMADLLHSSPTPPSKKLVRMVERTEEWMDEFFKCLPHEKRLEPLGIFVFAPILSVEHPIQWSYLRYLSEDMVDVLSGLAIYDVNLLPELTEYSSLASLPKLSLDIPISPHHVLRQVSLGIDLCTIPFINAASDAGIALTFTFPPPVVDSPQPLGVDMSDPENRASTIPLLDGCQCYACTKHHKAFLHHLLNAKEMLGWTLLQIHNHQVLTEFFAGIRQTLSKGLSDFEEGKDAFLAAYEPEIPHGTGARPRARGYHFKSEAAQEKINKPTWTAVESLAGGEDSMMQVDSDAVETPLVPEVDGQALAAKGFGQTQ